jgi:TrmH family RNA methyltransferase
MKAVLDNVSIVLVGIRTAGNIGSAARALKNMGLSHLVLVTPPRCDNPETYNLAWGAEEIVRGARICATLDEAVRDSGFVAGTTRRKGRTRRPVVDIGAAIPRIAAATTNNRVAILFGREDKGLSNDELSLCQLVFSIPASRRMPSLNIAQAVMVVCYELYRHATADHVETPPALVSQAELWKVYARLEQALASIGYGKEGDRRVLESVMRTLRRVFGRSGIADDEFRALHGICQQIERYVAGCETKRKTADWTD